MLINNYTIAALATPLGQAPLAIIRVSGEDAITYTSQIFHSKKNILDSSGHEVIFGYIYDPKTNNDVDQVLITVFKAPRSFTGENMVEITCHGGMVLFQKILDLLVKQGCSIAQKGEFSKRAFINGKMDLTQAEAIHDLIFSRSYKVSQLVLNSLKKNLFTNIQTIKSSILKLVAKIEVGIDYPEDDIESWDKNDIIFLESTMTEIRIMIESAKKTQTINKGYVVAIIGEPNAGKSSLLNLLVGEEKAIVSSIAGTTRDPIEVFLTLNDMPVTLIDTAGLRDNADNEIEEMGISKTKDIMVTADFNILMVDINHSSQEALKTQIETLKQEQVPFLLLWNKIDLATNPVKQSFLSSQEQILLSCKQQVGIEELITYLKSALTDINITDTQFFINQRQSHLLEQVEFSLNETLHLMQQEQLDLEILSLLLQKSLHIIGEIDGSDIQDNILETIFSEFCVGK